MNKKNELHQNKKKIAQIQSDNYSASYNPEANKLNTLLEDKMGIKMMENGVYIDRHNNAYMKFEINKFFAPMQESNEIFFHSGRKKPRDVKNAYHESEEILNFFIKFNFCYEVYNETDFTNWENGEDYKFIKFSLDTLSSFIKELEKMPNLLPYQKEEYQKGIIYRRI